MPKRKPPTTAWKPGQSGNPDGRKLEKLIGDQLRLILSEEIEESDAKGIKRKYKRLRLLAEQLVDDAMNGSAAHMAMVLDRVDGKVPQSHDVKNETTITVYAEAISAFDRWIEGAAARGTNGADSDVGAERSVLPDPVPPESTRH